MADKYFGHAPRELRAAAGARYLTTDLTLEEVGEQFGTNRANIWNWVKAAAGSDALKSKKNKFIDIWSRRIVGAEFHDCQQTELASDLLRNVGTEHSVQPEQLVLHSDNGAYEGQHPAGYDARPGCHAVV